MSTFVKDRKVSIGDLERIVRSGKPIAGIGKMRALAALPHADSAKAGTILEEVARNKKEEPNFRHMAVLGLYHRNGVGAREALIRTARTAEGTLAADIAMLFGRIGEQADRKTIVKLIEATPRHSRAIAKFALALLDYRFGERGRGLALKDVEPTRKRLGEWQEISVLALPRKHLEEVKAALSVEPVSVEFEMSRAKKIACGPETFAWVPTVASGAELPANRNYVAGVLLHLNPVTLTYSLSRIGLVTSNAKRAILTLHRPQTGAIMYIGNVDPSGSWELRSTAWPGLAPIQIKGTNKSGEIAFEMARSSTSVQRARGPKPFTVAPARAG
jgi:hypothetical protein